MQESVLNKLNQEPEMKQHIEGLVKHLPETSAKRDDRDCVPHHAGAEA